MRRTETMSQTVTPGGGPVERNGEGGPSDARVESASLRYVKDSGHGIRRLTSRTGFRYLDSNGRRIRDAGKLARIKSLVVPPAWREVWISPFAESHLQATGRDARGRSTNACSLTRVTRASRSSSTACETTPSGDSWWMPTLAEAQVPPRRAWPRHNPSRVGSTYFRGRRGNSPHACDKPYGVSVFTLTLQKIR